MKRLLFLAVFTVLQGFVIVAAPGEPVHEPVHAAEPVEGKRASVEEVEKVKKEVELAQDAMEKKEREIRDKAEREQAESKEREILIKMAENVASTRRGLKERISYDMTEQALSDAKAEILSEQKEIVEMKVDVVLAEKLQQSYVANEPTPQEVAGATEKKPGYSAMSSFYRGWLEIRADVNEFFGDYKTAIRLNEKLINIYKVIDPLEAQYRTSKLADVYREARQYRMALEYHNEILQNRVADFNNNKNTRGQVANLKAANEVREAYDKILVDLMSLEGQSMFIPGAVGLVEPALRDMGMTLKKRSGVEIKPYEILGVSDASVSDSALTAAKDRKLKELADKRTPETLKETEIEMAKVRKAYAILRDPQQRAEYDSQVQISSGRDRVVTTDIFYLDPLTQAGKTSYEQSVVGQASEAARAPEEHKAQTSADLLGEGGASSQEEIVPAQEPKKGPTIVVPLRPEDIARSIEAEKVVEPARESVPAKEPAVQEPVKAPVVRGPEVAAPLRKLVYDESSVILDYLRNGQRRVKRGADLKNQEVSLSETQIEEAGGDKEAILKAWKEHLDALIMDAKRLGEFNSALTAGKDVESIEWSKFAESMRTKSSS